MALPIRDEQSAYCHWRPTAIREEAMFQPVVPKAKPDQKRGRWYHVHVRRSGCESQYLEVSYWEFGVHPPGGVGLKSLLIQRLEGESASSVRMSSMKASRDLKALVKVFACSISLLMAVWLHLIDQSCRNNGGHDEVDIKSTSAVSDWNKRHCICTRMS
jgi:hypothetical protein